MERLKKNKKGAHLSNERCRALSNEAQMLVSRNESEVSKGQGKRVDRKQLTCTIVRVRRGVLR